MDKGLKYGSADDKEIIEDGDVDDESDDHNSG